MSSESMDARRMRAHNSRHVLRAVKKLGPISRADITRHTRLSPPTVSALVNSLLKAGLLEEHGEESLPAGASFSCSLSTRVAGWYWAGQIGTTALHLVLSDMKGGWVERRRVALNLANESLNDTLLDSSHVAA